MAIPKNSDLTPANKTPGIYVQIQSGGAGAGDPFEQSTVLLVGEMLSGGAWAPGGVYDVLSEQDVIDGADGAFSDTGSATTGASTLRRMYRAAVAQVGEGNVRVKAAPVSATGTAATYTITVHVVSTSTLLSATNPTTGGTLRVQIAGEEFSVSYGTSDTNASIATLLRAELVKSRTLPVSVGAVSTASITLTYNIAGVIGEDLPIRAYYTAGSGVYLGVGTLTVANTAATSAGSVKLYMGSQTCTTAIDPGGSPKTAADVATAIKAALLLDDFPLIGGGIVTATFPLFCREGRDVRRVSANVITSATQTVQLSGGSATSGTPDATRTYNGTQGSGLPTLTTALSNIDTAGSFGEWVCPWNTAGSSSTGLTALATAIEAAANGDSQKNQHLTICSVGTETDAAAIGASVTPTFGSSLRYTIGFCTDAGQQGYELAARRAAMFAAWVTPATNSDAAFGGTPFKTRPGVPLNLPSLRIRSTKAQVNAAIIDGLEPWTVGSGSLSIVRGRNASSASDEVLWDPSWIRQADMMRRRLKSDGAATFIQPKIKADGIVNQSGEITIASVEGWAIGEIAQFELEGFYDGAEQLKSAVSAEVDPAVAGRINLVVPCSPVPMMHQLGIVLAKSAPSLAA